MGLGEEDTSPPKPIPGAEGSFGVKPQVGADDVGASEVVASGARCGRRRWLFGEAEKGSWRCRWPCPSGTLACRFTRKGTRASTGVMLSDLGDVLERLVVRVDLETGRP